MFLDVVQNLGLIAVQPNAPQNPKTGDAWLQTPGNNLQIFNGFTWAAIGGGAGAGIVDGATFDITQVPPAGAVGTFYQVQMGAVPNPAWGLNSEFTYFQGGSAIIQLGSTKFLVLSNAIDAGFY